MKTICALISLIITSLSFSQWTTITAPPTNFRTDHSYGFALEGKGYLVAGNNDATGETSANFFSYDPAQDIWTTLPNFPGGTRGYAIGDQIDGKAYFGFGTGSTDGQNDTQQSDLWVFDPATEQWSELSSCPCNVRIHPAFVAHQGKIYMGVGGNETLGNLGDWWSYDIASDTWEEKATFPGFNRHHPYQFSAGDFVYVGFGHGNQGSLVYKDFYRYDPANDSWTQVSDITGQARVAGTQFSHNGFGYVLSGDGENHTSMSNGEFWRYDGNLDTWEQLPSHPGQSRWAPASFVLNDEVYLINGSYTPSYFYPSTSYKFNLNNLSASISENSESQFKVYPNPASTDIKIDISEFNNQEKLEVKIVNQLGQVLIDEPLNSNSTIHLSNINTGIYFVEIYSGNRKIGSQKFNKY